MMNGQLRPVDHTALRFNQVFVIALLAAAFISDQITLVLFVSLAMILGTIYRSPAFKPFYRLLRSIRKYSPEILMDNPEPHMFSQGFGGVVLAAASLVFWSGSITVIGWALTWLVIALAALNLFGGFCLGCAIYYWLNRLGIAGFSKQPPADTVPGRKPSIRA
jgi:hypothetical protein